MKNKIDVNTLLFFSIALFSFFLPISEKLSTLSIFICLGLGLLNWRKWNKFLFKKGFFLIALYIIYVLAYIKDDMGFGVHLFETKASLLIFPAIFSFINIDYKKGVFILKAFVFGCVFSYFICLIHPFIFNFDWIEFEFLPIKQLSYLTINNENYNWVNYFVSLRFTNTIDRAYFACYIVTSIAFVIVFRKSYEKRDFIVLLSLLLLALSQVHSMAGFLSFTASMTIFLLLIKNVKKKAALFSIFLVATFVYASYSPRVKEYVKDIKSLIETNSFENHFLNERAAFWKNALTIFSKNPITGNGIKKTQRLMNKEHQETLNWSSEWVKINTYNAHNQYLQFLAESGVIGLSVFLMSFLYFLFLLRKKQNKSIRRVGFYFLLIFSIHLMSESMIYRYLGISFFSFFYCLFLSFDKINLTSE